MNEQNRLLLVFFAVLIVSIVAYVFMPWRWGRQRRLEEGLISGTAISKMSVPMYRDNVDIYQLITGFLYFDLTTGNLVEVENFSEGGKIRVHTRYGKTFTFTTKSSETSAVTEDFFSSDEVARTGTFTPFTIVTASKLETKYLVLYLSYGSATHLVIYNVDNAPNRMIHQYSFIPGEGSITTNVNSGVINVSYGTSPAPSYADVSNYTALASATNKSASTLESNYYTIQQAVTVSNAASKDVIYKHVNKSFPTLYWISPFMKYNTAKGQLIVSSDDIQKSVTNNTTTFDELTPSGAKSIITKTTKIYNRPTAANNADGTPSATLTMDTITSAAAGNFSATIAARTDGNLGIPTDPFSADMEGKVFFSVVPSPLEKAEALVIASGSSTFICLHRYDRQLQMIDFFDVFLFDGTAPQTIRVSKGSAESSTLYQTNLGTVDSGNTTTIGGNLDADQKEMIDLLFASVLFGSGGEWTPNGYSHTSSSSNCPKVLYQGGTTTSAAPTATTTTTSAAATVPAVGDKIAETAGSIGDKASNVAERVASLADNVSTKIGNLGGVPVVDQEEEEQTPESRPGAAKQRQNPNANVDAKGGPSTIYVQKGMNGASSASPPPLPANNDYYRRRTNTKFTAKPLAADFSVFFK